MMVCENINVYDINLNRIGILYSWVSMLWEEGYNTMGQFQLEMQQTDRALELIQKDRYCGIGSSDTLMLITSIQILDGEIIANGSPATIALDNRVSDTVVSNQNAETAMRNLVSNMTAWPCVELGTSAGLSDTFGPQTSDQSIEEYCEKIGEECDIGFKMVYDRTGKKLQFVCYKPEENPNARYSTMYGNITDIEYMQSDVEYKNVALVAGEGQDEERITVTAGATSSTGADRREMYIDARSERMEEDESLSDYQKRLVAYGEEKLLDQLQIESVEFTVTDDTGLGEIVYANIPEIGVQVKARVKTVTITSENNGTSRAITIGEPMVLNRR